MSLFTAIQLANNSLQAVQISLQVVGNNVANVSTPGYLRQRAVLEPAPTQQLGNLVLGLGVHVKGIVQEIDRFLAERLRGAVSDLASGETQEETYVELETLIGELSDGDLSTALTSFFSSIHGILNEPENVSTRNLAVLRGSALAADLVRLGSRVREIRSSINDRVVAAAADINRLLREIADLNVQIVTTETGAENVSDAVGLRDQREAALGELAALIDIQVVEQPEGSVTVFNGNGFLVFGNVVREVTTASSTDRGLQIAELRLAATDTPIRTSSGKVAGLLASRDEILGGFLDQLDDFASTLIFEFNKAYSGGQGLSGYQELTSELGVDDADAALDHVGLPLAPVNGSFQVQVTDKQSGLTETTDVFVRLAGLDSDTSLNDLAAALDAIDGLAAEVTPEGRLTIRSDTQDLEFAFAGDTSGVLAALGLNTFFAGSSAADISVNEVVRADPAKFAASRGGVGADTENAVALAGFLDTPLESQDGDSLAGLYERFILETTQAASASRAVAEGFRVFQKALEGKHLGIAGVNIDEEAVRMITFQRLYQASARFIVAIDELLEYLVEL